MTQIFNWKKDVDMDIWKALEIPPEVIEAFQRGSGFSGRTDSADDLHQPRCRCELNELVAAVDRDILRPVSAAQLRPSADVRDSAEEFA